MSNVFLSERGFGSNGKGHAFVIAGQDGEPLTMQLIKFPNKVIGGQVMLVNGKVNNKFLKSYMPVSQKQVYEIFLNLEKSLGTVTIRAFYKEDENGMWKHDILKTAFITREDGGRDFMSSFGMPNSEEAIQLLDNGILENALNGVIQRIILPEKPSGLFYGHIAQDAEMLIWQWAEKRATANEEV